MSGGIEQSDGLLPMMKNVTRSTGRHLLTRSPTTLTATKMPLDTVGCASTTAASQVQHGAESLLAARSGSSAGEDVSEPTHHDHSVETYASAYANEAAFLIDNEEEDDHHQHQHQPAPRTTVWHYRGSVVKGSEEKTRYGRKPAKSGNKTTEAGEKARKAAVKALDSSALQALLRAVDRPPGPHSKTLEVQSERLLKICTSSGTRCQVRLRFRPMNVAADFFLKTASDWRENAATFIYEEKEMKPRVRRRRPAATASSDDDEDDDGGGAPPPPPYRFLATYETRNWTSAKGKVSSASAWSLAATERAFSAHTDRQLIGILNGALAGFDVVPKWGKIICERETTKLTSNLPFAIIFVALQDVVFYGANPPLSLTVENCSIEKQT